MFDIYQLQAILDKAEIWICKNWVQAILQDNANLKIQCIDVYQLKSGLEWHLSQACEIDDDFTQQTFRILYSQTIDVGDQDVAIVANYRPTGCDALNDLYIIDGNFEFLKGDTGQTGPTGGPGDSAYQIWLDAGNTGTEQDFLDSLVGPTGATGTPGISAYQVWLNNGHTGSESDFLASLKGAKGDTGNTGATGGVGPAGANLVMPSGAMMPFAMYATPAGGWLRCDGSAASRTTYANLFAAIGTVYGIGDGSTTFNVPDTRGVFIRDLDSLRGIDTGRVLTNTLQQDQFQGHTFGVQSGLYKLDRGSVGQGSVDTPVAGVTKSDYKTDAASAERAQIVADTNGNGAPRVGTETRPVNLAFPWYIKT